MLLPSISIGERLLTSVADEYFRELHAGWRDTKALICLAFDGRALAAMQDVENVGLDHMTAIAPTITSLKFPLMRL